MHLFVAATTRYEVRIQCAMMNTPIELCLVQCCLVHARIRESFETRCLREMEVDETGGKRKKEIRGRGSFGKAPVVGAKQGCCKAYEEDN